MKFNTSAATLFLAGLAIVQAAPKCDSKTTFKACAKKSGCFWDSENGLCLVQQPCEKWDGAPGLCGENSCYYDIFEEECKDPCEYRDYKKSACGKMDHCSYDLASKQCLPKNCAKHAEDFDGCISDGCAFDTVMGDCAPKIPCDYYDGDEIGCNAGACVWIPGVDQCEEPCSYNHKSKSKCLKSSLNCEFDKKTKECTKVECMYFHEDVKGCRANGCYLNSEMGDCRDKVDCAAANDSLKCEAAGCSWNVDSCVEPCDYFHLDKKKCNRKSYCAYDKDTKFCGYE